MKHPLRLAAAFAIRFYGRFLSPITPGKCRYYPSCSDYALLLVEHGPVLPGVFKGFFRILRCNQLFPGGFDHPVIPFQKPSLLRLPAKTDPETIRFWLIPADQKTARIMKKV